jgi:lysyl endopeptidase
MTQRCSSNSRPKMIGRAATWAIGSSCAMAWLAVAGATGAAGAAMAQGLPREAFGTYDETTRHTPAKPGVAAPSARYGRALPAAPVLTLPALNVRSLLAEDEQRGETSTDKIQRIGVERVLNIRPEAGQWIARPEGGGVWIHEISAPGAVGLRLHLEALALPVGSTIVVFPATADRMAPIHLARHETTPATSSDLWLSTVPGDRIRIEISTPSGGRPQFRLDTMQQLYVDPVANAAGPCHNDVTCFPQWSNVALAVGKLTFVAGKSTSACTGELLNTLTSDQTPYFLTAHHCISTPKVAATAEIFWKYQTTTCDGPPPNINTVPTSSGATLLGTGVPSDFTLLMINGALPRNLYWAGWTAAPVDDGTASAAIHHPSGDFKRISFGNKASNTTCGGANHVRIDWTSGPTEVGSSGGGLFRADTQQLYGQLDCGPSACGNVTDDDFGAFDVTYPQIASFLAGGSDDATPANNACSTALRTIPGDSPGRIVKSVAPDWYRIRLRPGGTLTATTTFDNADGDVDMRLFNGCGGAILDTSNSQSNREQIVYANTTDDFVIVQLQVFLFLGTRNTYDLNVTIQ